MFQTQDKKTQLSARDAEKYRLNIEKKEKKIKKKEDMDRRNAKDRQMRYLELNAARKEKFDFSK